MPQRGTHSADRYIGLRAVQDVQGNPYTPLTETEVCTMRIATLAVALLLTAGCTKTVNVETDPKTGKTDVDVQPPGVPEAWNGTLSPVGGSSITGTATGTTSTNTTSVTVNISGAKAGDTLPWHIHDGKCGDASPPIFGDASAYPPLVVGANGTATGSATINGKLNEARSYIVNVHASPTNLATIVSCGDFND